VGVSPAFGAHHLAPAVHEFTPIHPEISVSLLLDDGHLDLIRDGLDLSLRIVPELKDASYVSRVLAHVPQCLVASPDYLAERGEPKCLEDLRDHNCLIHSIKSPTDIWVFGAGDLSTGIPVSGTIRSNFGAALYTATLLGAGISLHPFYMVSDDIEKGRLRVVLVDAPPPVSLSIYAIFTNRKISVLARNFLEFIAKRLSRGF
jgi:DNA-binding transcriptional LysR family regulator